MAAQRRLAHKGIHNREQAEAVRDAVCRFKEAVPFLFEDQGADSLPADFDIRVHHNRIFGSELPRSRAQWRYPLCYERQLFYDCLRHGVVEVVLLINNTGA